MFRFGGYNLPNTVDYNKFGAAATLKEKILYTSGNVVMVHKPNSNVNYKFCRRAEKLLIIIIK